MSWPSLLVESVLTSPCPFNSISAFADRRLSSKVSTNDWLSHHLFCHQMCQPFLLVVVSASELFIASPFSLTSVSQVSARMSANASNSQLTSTSLVSRYSVLTFAFHSVSSLGWASALASTSPSLSPSV